MYYRLTFAPRVTPWTGEVFPEDGELGRPHPRTWPFAGDPQPRAAGRPDDAAQDDRVRVDDEGLQVEREAR